MSIDRPGVYIRWNIHPRQPGAVATSLAVLALVHGIRGGEHVSVLPHRLLPDGEDSESSGEQTRRRFRVAYKPYLRSIAERSDLASRHPFSSNGRERMPQAA